MNADEAEVLVSEKIKITIRKWRRLPQLKKDSCFGEEEKYYPQISRIAQMNQRLRSVGSLKARNPDLSADGAD